DRAKPNRVEIELPYANLTIEVRRYPFELRAPRAPFARLSEAKPGSEELRREEWRPPQPSHADVPPRLRLCNWTETNRDERMRLNGPTRCHADLDVGIEPDHPG